VSHILQVCGYQEVEFNQRTLYDTFVFRWHFVWTSVTESLLMKIPILWSTEKMLLVSKRHLLSHGEEIVIVVHASPQPLKHLCHLWDKLTVLSQQGIHIACELICPFSPSLPSLRFYALQTRHWLWLIYRKYCKQQTLFYPLLLICLYALSRCVRPP
jgi:hypothetical protein